MVKLGVNIDHIATLRQARKEREPDPVVAAGICELAGADGITVHLREDRRHIQDRDVRLLRQTIATKLNLEMALSEDIICVALDVKPDDVCIVPEKRKELTTEGGLDVAASHEAIAGAVSRLRSGGITVSIFIDPDEEQVRAAHEAGANCVELHTGTYARYFRSAKGDPRGYFKELTRLEEAAILAKSLGLAVNAGHGLDYRNVRQVARLAVISELNIGFSIIAKAALVGLEQAVREMKALINEPG